MAQQRKNSGKKQRSALALALWVLAAIILLVIFLINQNRIITNLKSTDFFAHVFGRTPSFVENSDVPAEPEIEKNDVEPGAGNVSIAVAPASSGTRPAVTAENDAARQQAAEAAGAKEPKTDAPQAEAPQSVQQSPAARAEPAAQQPSPSAATAGQTMTVRLFFMEIESDGSVARHEVSRTMRKSDSPLVDTVNALIAGPTASEEDAGCRSLISSGTKLLGASVREGVATLNFSGEFEFNQYGVEGTRGQLQQIVYTATAFPTVDSVQFLIDGEKREYLGSEGVWIGTPLNRRSF